jgi:hypothetical protein
VFPIPFRWCVIIPLSLMSNSHAFISEFRRLKSTRFLGTVSIQARANYSFEATAKCVLIRSLHTQVTHRLHHLFLRCSVSLTPKIHHCFYNVKTRARSHGHRCTVVCIRKESPKKLRRRDRERLSSTNVESSVPISLP